MRFNAIKKKSFSKEDSLRAKPVKNASVNWQKDGEGEISITVRRKRSRWLKALCHIPEEKVIILDELGSYVWALCDGEKTVEEMIERFCQKYKLNRKEAEISLLTYLRQLARKGIIGFLVDREGR